MMRFLRWLIVGVVVVGVGTFAYLRLAPKPVNAAANAQTAAVQRGILTATVTAAGNIQAAQVVNLDFTQSGTVQKVNVQAGDHVIAGQVLAELNSANLALQVQNAQVNLKLAQDKLTQAKNPNAPQDIASARSKLQAAQAALDKLLTPPTQADVAADQAALAGAQSAYQAALQSAGTSSTQLTAAAAALDKAQGALQQAQAAYDKVAGSPNIGARTESVNLQSATADYNQAKANYQALAATSGSSASSQVAQARSTLQQAQATLTKLTTPASQDDITSARATVDQAQNDLNKLLAGSDAPTLDIAQNGVDQAQIALQQAQIQLQQTQILAPFDGVVTQVNLVPGQTDNQTTGVGTNTGNFAIQVADLNHLEIVVPMDEIDYTQLKVGQPVQVSLDALPNTTVQGQVTQLSPSGTLTQGVVNYPVTVALTNASPAVKPGMSANLNIVIAQRDNVLQVPNRAVRGQGQQKTVTVLFEGQQMTVPVRTGLSNDTTTEIVSGLQEGDQVVVNATGATQAGFHGPGGGPGLIGGGRGG